MPSTSRRRWCRPRASRPPVSAAGSPDDDLDLARVIEAAAAEAGITVTFRPNHDGSRQIVEDGVVTSGFLSARGNFAYSASGKSRKGGPVQLGALLPEPDRAGGQALAQCAVPTGTTDRRPGRTAAPGD